MAKDRKRPGQQLSDRLAERGKRGLERRTMPQGGEVIGGPLAEEALSAVGARAMTMDRTIFVGRGFDPGSAEGQSLYAHEMVHVEGSGGRAGHMVGDAEEMAARSAEAMVLHRMANDGAPDNSSAGADPSSAGAPDEEADSERKADPQKGYQALVEMGLNHDDIIQQLAMDCLSVMDEGGQTNHDRAGDLLKLF
jgi:hypothetical protein